ncbi:MULTISPECIES: Imm53 family immunity protein [Burkholderia]|uniref:Imm53 family immunity protein n=1 Tax=Burkholderia TaxID=32008 RepID=UPI000C0730DE|nr:MULTISPECIES: Imm53 family immunity protein [Burkholderia]MCA8031459.1 immunity 53 family protein [Burkholderia arboris]MCA8239578.1 immunity 53 family protein [Burkholderia sp. AU32262]MDN7700210.1 Imm53 family immunity protein [Burkholderia sp. AU44665]PHP86437.1 hypothetical protein CFB52_017855 [Burkholderia sp. AU18528]RQV87221.1 hypothetical protein DF160_01880 [Burkholderia anthina]
MNDLIDALQHWYTSQCDDVWEHSYGVKISTIDNPGWEVRINGVSGRKLIDINAERDESDWISVTATKEEFVGYGGSSNLKEILMLAMDWLH